MTYGKISEVFNMDNLVFMRNCPDKKYDVGVVDPEYLDKNQPNQFMRAKGGMIDWRGAPKEEFFYHLFRITKEQIIFGGNYFTAILDYSKYAETSQVTDIVPFLYPNNNWFVWNKKIADGMNYSMIEQAWISIKKVSKIFPLSPVGKTSDWHSTSKPKEVYDYIFKTYLTPDMHILDTNLGSGSSRISAYSNGFNFTGIEINENYFKKSQNDFEAFRNKHSLFLGDNKVETEFTLDF